MRRFWLPVFLAACGSNPVAQDAPELGQSRSTLILEGEGAAALATRLAGSYYNPNGASEGWYNLTLEADGTFTANFAGRRTVGDWGVRMTPGGRRAAELVTVWSNGVEASEPVLVSDAGPILIETERGSDLLVHSSEEEAAWFAACPDNACGTGSGREACFTPWHVRAGCLDTLCTPILVCDYPENKAALCAEEFGTELTKGFGRLDGIVWAVLKPTDQQCPRPNGDHVIVQVVADGHVYRLVVNVQSDYGDDRRVGFAEVPVESEFNMGWNAGVSFDYGHDLGLTSDAFVAYEMAPLAELIVSRIQLGARISVYAHTGGGDSAHKIHRNKASQDGAIILNAGSRSATALAFRFATQSF